MPISVVKRDGSRALLNLEKIQKQVALACNGISDVSPSMVELRAQIELYDGIPTSIIDELLIKAAVNLIDDEQVGHVNYQNVAGRLRLSVLRKEVHGTYEPPHLYTTIKKNIKAGVYTSELLQWYTEEEWNKLDDLLEHDKDEKYTYSAISQLIDKYLVQNRVTRQVYETPQVRYMIAAATAFHAEKVNRLKWVRDYYNCASDGKFTLATPVLAGLGTPTKQFSSCVLIKSGDSLKSIFASGEMMANYVAKKAGIGLEVGRIRPIGSPIRGGEIKHTGLIPFLKKFQADLKSCAQGGIRNAAATITYPIWHAQFEDLIVLKNNKGTEENRIRQLDYSVVLSKIFFQRLLSGGKISFFDPNRVPDLYEAFYRNIEEFDELYVRYENDSSIKQQSLSAKEVFDKLLTERTDTGRIYLMFTDNVQKQGSFDPLENPVYCSNLCQEILLPTKSFERIEDDNGRISLCTLGSTNWGSFTDPEDMRKSVRVLTRSLSNILDYQDFLSVQSHLANQEFRPLGIGVSNLAYWHAKRNLKYGQADSLAEVKSWMEHQVFYATEMSIELAEERGACLLSHTTAYGKGVFPWEKRAAGVNELTDFAPTMAWDKLRSRMLKTGVRHAVLSGLPPIESSSVVINSTNGIELPMSLMSNKGSKANKNLHVVPEYNKLKKRYQLMYETDCLDYLKTAAVLAAYTDQSISTNTFYSPARFEDGKVPMQLILSHLMMAYKWGLKTLYYSLIDKQGLKRVTESAPEVIEEVIEEDCESCKL